MKWTPLAGASGVKFPTRVSAMGGHFMFDDDQQTPNVLNCAFEFDRPPHA